MPSYVKSLSKLPLVSYGDSIEAALVQTLHMIGNGSLQGRRAELILQTLELAVEHKAISTRRRRLGRGVRE